MTKNRLYNVCIYWHTVPDLSVVPFVTVRLQCNDDRDVTLRCSMKSVIGAIVFTRYLFVVLHIIVHNIRLVIIVSWFPRMLTRHTVECDSTQPSSSSYSSFSFNK